MNRTDRLYALVEELRARAPRPVRAADLSAHFEVSVRTIERDILALMQAGVPIWSSTGPRGGYSIDPRRTMPPLNLNADEATAIAVALAANPVMPFARAGQTALRKLVAAMASSDADAAAKLAKRVHVSRTARKDLQVMRRVEEAVADGAVIDIEYRDREGRITTRTVEAHGIAESRRQWYLVSWCRTRNEPRTFRLDRIVNVDVTEQRAEPRDLDEMIGSFLVPVIGPVADLLRPGTLGNGHSVVDKSKLLISIERERARWTALLDEVGPDRMTSPGATGHWSVKDVVAHVTQRERWLRAMLDAAFSGADPTRDDVYGLHTYPEQFDGDMPDDDRNAIAYEVHRDRGLDDVLAESAEVSAQLLAWVGACPDDRLEVVVVGTHADPSKPGGGRVLRVASEVKHHARWWDPLWRWVSQYQHYGQHTVPIRAWLDQIAAVGPRA